MTKYQPGTVLRLPRDESVTYTVLPRQHPNGLWLRGTDGAKFPVNLAAVHALMEVQT